MMKLCELWTIISVGCGICVKITICLNDNWQIISE